MKGLDEVVVRPEVEAGNAVLQRVAGGKDEHSRRRTIGLEGPHQVKAVAVGQRQVEQHAIVAVELNFLVGLGEVGRHLHHVAAGAQRIQQGRAQRGFVFDKQQLHDKTGPRG